MIKYTIISLLYVRGGNTYSNTKIYSKRYIRNSMQYIDRTLIRLLLRKSEDT